MCAFPAAQTSGTPSRISPLPAMKKVKTEYGELLTPAKGRLTPTGQGRIKAPPVCVAPALLASCDDELSRGEVCFSSKEADSCAEKAFRLSSNAINGSNVEEMPLNIEKCDPGFSWETHTESAALAASGPASEGNSSACGRSSIGNEIAVVKNDPSLQVVRTDIAVSSGDEQPLGSIVQIHGQIDSVSTTGSMTQHVLKGPQQKNATTMSKTFTNKLVKENCSRQGRSLQRWLVHTPSEELVRQVAGTIPITRDGRIVLVSASRKSEWILPKGGWDLDETKEQCAARETFEEAGLLGRLGGCLMPVDYETRKARNRRLKVESASKVGKDDYSNGDAKRKGENCPSDLERLKMSSTIKNVVLLESAGGGGCNSNSAPHLSLKATTPVATLFDPKNHSYVRLFLFPLYINAVKSDWPEKGRLRKLADIDEAIYIMKVQNRPYFRKGLEMAKERGLHLVKPY